MQSVVLDIRMLQRSGIGVYLQGLLEGFCYLEDAPRFVFYGPRHFRAQVPERLCELFVIRDLPIYSIREQVLFPEDLRSYPLFHAPHYNIPLRFRGKIVVTIHDLNHLVYPENLPSSLHRMYAKYMFHEASIRAAHVIVDSEKMRQDVMRHLGVEPERITVLPLAVSRSFLPCKDTDEIRAFQKARKLPERYLFTVGINKPHKNFPFLLRTLADLWKSKILDLPLVLCVDDGKGDRGFDTLVNQLGIASSVIFPGKVERQDMPKLYAGAEALIFPSLYEGFGLPPLEAMKMGVPVLCSNRAPMTEVAGDAALYFDPASGEELKKALLRILTKSNLRPDLVAKGKKNAARFDWEQTARGTLKIYQDVLGQEM